MRATGGFTIVETLIVLAVTGLLFASAVILINGRQSKTEFQTGINNTQQQIQQIINETSSGYFPDSNNFKCAAGAIGQPVITAGSGTGQGTNSGCVFLGKVMQFAPAGSTDSYALHTVAGNKSGQTIATASPVDVFNILSSTKFENGLTVYCMKYNGNDCLSGTDTAGVGFIAGDSAGNISSTNASTGLLNSGAQQVSLYALAGGTQVNSSNTASVQSAINLPAGIGLVHANKVVVCMVSGGTNQSGLITIGTGNANAGLSVSVAIKAGTTC
jgi:type II secretory pathway pseudopilin PulG